jgi:hypothetical protein
MGINTTKFSVDEDKIIKEVTKSLNLTLDMLTALNKSVEAALNLLEVNHFEEFGLRPNWPELALRSALEYMHETTGAWDEMINEIKDN